MVTSSPFAVSSREVHRSSTHDLALHRKYGDDVMTTTTTMMMVMVMKKKKMMVVMMDPSPSRRQGCCLKVTLARLS